MITLITGTPGAGKTAWTVQELTRLPSQRKIYIHGIPQLKIAHEPIFCTSELCDHCREHTHIVDYPGGIDEQGNKYDGFSIYEEIDKPGIRAYLVEEWNLWATEGSLIVIDEVQRIWRPLGSKVPDEIAALETHRHKGLDLWLISQGPHLFHTNIRLLIGRHIHLVSTWKGRNEYEFPECRQNVTSRGDAVIRPYKLPKKIFHLYKSASLHVKTTHRRPLSFYFLIAVVLLAALMGVKAYNRFSNLNTAKETPGAVEARAGAVAPTAPGVPTFEEHQKSKFPDFKPQIPSVPASAPAYEHLVKVTQVPHLIGCVKTPDFCRCYTRQGVPTPVSFQFCGEYLAGHYFNPYRSEKPDLQLAQSKTPVVTQSD